MWATPSSTALHNSRSAGGLGLTRDPEADALMPNLPGMKRDIYPYFVHTQKQLDRTARSHHPLTQSLSTKAFALSQGANAASGSMRPLSASALDLRRHQKQNGSAPLLSATMRRATQTASNSLRPNEQKQLTETMVSEAQRQAAEYQTGNPLYRTTLKQPNYVLSDREVLRFFVYFEEQIREAGGLAVTSTRIRKLSLLYYMADGKISLEESRQVNSGIPQGRFMKPTATTKPDGSPYTPADFVVGKAVTMFGRNLVIVDADPKTRAFYQHTLQQPLSPPIPYPDDGFREERKRVEGIWQQKRSTRPKGEYFLKEDKVLRFYCAYKDDRLGGGQREYIFHYYLLNDTVEIREVPKDGCTHFGNFLRRQKLPRDSLFVPTGYGGVISPRDPQKKRVDYVTWEDLLCGQTLRVYGHLLLLHSCDRSTLEWYKSQGIYQRPLKLYSEGADNFLESNIDDPLGQRYGAPVPPYNGYGSAEDMYAMGLSVEPYVAMEKEDFYRFQHSENKVLRYQAKLATENSFNGTRDFVVNYFLTDDTVSVFEPPIKNSGVVGGLFLARGKYKKFISVHNECGSEDNPIGGGKGGKGGSMSRFVRPTDFFPGAVVHFEMPTTGSLLFAVRVIDSDDYTRRLLQEDAFLFPWTPVQLSLTNLSERLSIANCAVRARMRAADVTETGLLQADTFRRLVREMEAEATKWTPPSMNLSDKELNAIADEFQDPKTGAIFYADFIDCLVMVGTTSIREQELQKQGKSVMTVEEAIRQMLQRGYKTGPNGTGGRIRASFRRFDPSGSGTVFHHDWVQVLTEHDLQSLMTLEKAEMIVLDYDTNKDGSLDYNRLCDSIFQGDFDRHHEETTVRLTKRLLASPISSPKKELDEELYD